MDNIDKIIKLVKICMKNNIQFNLERTGNENCSEINFDEKKYTLFLPNENDPHFNKFINEKLNELEQLVH